MSDTPTTSPIPADPAPMGELGRLTGVFFQPGAVFADLAKRPRWIVPVVLSIIGALVFVWCVSQRIGWEHVVRQQIEKSPQTADLTAAQREDIVRTQSKVAGIAAFVMPVIAVPVVLLASSGIILMMFSTLLGGDAKFKQVLAVVSYAGVPGLLSLGLAVLMLFVKSPEDIDINNPVGLNLGFYLPETMPKWLVSMGGSIDVFSFWAIALIAIGLATVSPRSSKGSAWAAVLLPWGVYVIAKAGLAMIFS